MKLPTEQEAVAFFRSIGHELRREPGKKPRGWVLLSPDGNMEIEGKGYVEVFLAWLPHALHLLNEDAKFRAFMAAFRSGNDEERRHLRALAEEHYNRPATSVALARFMVDRYPDTLDSLPRNWRSVVKQILRQPYGDSYFPARAHLTLLQEH